MDTQRFCSNCGEAIREDEKFCPKCGQPVDKKYTKCPSCGAEVEAGQMYCNSCGANLNAYVNSAYSQKKVKQNSNVAIASFVCGILGCLFGGYLLNIIALVLGNKEKNRSTLGKAGWILGWIGVVISTILLIIYICELVQLLNKAAQGQY